MSNSMQLSVCPCGQCARSYSHDHLNPTTGNGPHCLPPPPLSFGTIFQRVSRYPECGTPPAQGLSGGA
jgi:hypothetical protein